MPVITRGGAKGGEKPGELKDESTTDSEEDSKLGAGPESTQLETKENIKTFIKMDSFVRKPEKININSKNLCECWKEFKQDFDNYLVAIEANSKKEEVKAALLMNIAGLEATKQLNLSDVDKKSYEKVVNAFKNYCEPRKNEVYESFIFNRRKQEPEDTFMSFVMDLKRLVRTCDFQDEDRMVRDRVVLGVIDVKLQKRYLEVENLTLVKAIEMGQATELAKSQMENIKQPGTSVDAINSERGTSNVVNKGASNTRTSTGSSKSENNNYKNKKMTFA